MHSFKATPALCQPLEAYLLQLYKQRKLAVDSQSLYRGDLYLFRDFLADYKVATWRDVTPAQAHAFFIDLALQQYSAASIARMLSSIRGLLRFLLISKVIDTDPLLAFQAPKAPNRVSANIGLDLQNLLQFSATNFIDARDKAILSVLQQCDMSVQQLMHLDLFSIDLAAGVIGVEDSARKIRNIALNQGIALEAWLDYRGQVATYDQALFISKTGKRLSVRAIQLRIALRGAQQGIRGLSARVLRNYARAQDSSDSENNRAKLQLMSKSEQIQQLKRQYQYFHPRSRQSDIS